jgi:hypothetical protein
MRPLVAHCHLGLGSLYARNGRRKQARAELAAAIDLYRAMGMTFWLPQAEAVLAQVVGVETPEASEINRHSASRSANRRHALHLNQEIGLGETGDNDERAGRQLAREKTATHLGNGRKILAPRDISRHLEEV